MGNDVMRILTIPAEKIIGQGAKGIIRGCLECSGEITVDAPFEMDPLRAFRIMAAFDSLAHDHGISVMGCYFIRSKK